MDKLLRLRVFVGIACMVVLYFSASFAHGLFHGPDQGLALNLLRILLGEAAIAVCIVSFLGLLWAVLLPRWVVGLFRFAWHHLKFAVYVFYTSLVVVGLYGVVLRVLQR